MQRQRPAYSYVQGAESGLEPDEIIIEENKADKLRRRTSRNKSLLASQMAPLKLVTTINEEEISLLDYPGQNNPHSC